jgi:hypothetical protein
MSWPVIGAMARPAVMFARTRATGTQMFSCGEPGPLAQASAPSGPAPAAAAPGLSIARLVSSFAPGAPAANAASSAVSLIACGPEDS